jgi:DNA helicase-2/ATP-dependent DNA helicase PcrA
MDSREDLEEERRLFYVAITRACESCTLSYATTRFKWGQLHQGDPSRFLDEIDEQYIIQPAGIINSGYSSRNIGSEEARQTGGWSKRAVKPSSISGRNLTKINLSQTPTPNEKMAQSAGAPNGSVDQQIPSGKPSISEGITVKHAKFGKGKVVKIEGEEPNVKATIFFPAAGQKQLLLKFAKLEIL